MIFVLCSLASAASWEAPPTPSLPMFVAPGTAEAVRARVASAPAEQVGADFAREAHRIVEAWFDDGLAILQRGEYGGQVASLRDDLDRHVARLDLFGVSPVRSGRDAVAAAVRAVPHRGSPASQPPAVGDWQPSGALEAWVRQLDHVARVAERQAFGAPPGEDGGAGRLAADARWLLAGFERLALSGC